MASTQSASTAVGGLCHAAERPVRWAAEDEPNTDLIEALNQTGSHVDVMSRQHAGRHFKAWCEAFMGPVKLQTGKWRYKGFHWHAFSWELCRAESGKKAFQLYSAEVADSLIIIPEFWGESACARFCGSSPDLTSTGLDLYVFPESLAWTMAFTHEQPGIGPFFTRREWCASAG